MNLQIIVVTFVAFCSVTNAVKHCKQQNDCGANGACAASDVSNQGVCICLFGFKVTDSGDCVSASGKSSSDETTSAQPEPEPAQTTTVLAIDTTTPEHATSDVVTTTPPPTAATITSSSSVTTVSQTSVQVTTTAASILKVLIKNVDKNSTEILPNNDCPNLIYARTNGGNAMCLNGGECLAVNSTSSHCICRRYWTGKQCATILKPKPINESIFDSLLIFNNTYFLNKRSFDATTFGRNYANDIRECAHLCSEADPFCKAVNFGTYLGISVCELLSVKANDAYLTPWLVAQEGWTYAYLP